MDDYNSVHERDDNEELVQQSLSTSTTNLPHSFYPQTHDDDWAFHQSQPEFQASFSSNTVDHPHVSQEASSRMGRNDLGFGSLVMASHEYSDSYADTNISPLRPDMFGGDYGQAMFEANSDYQTDTTLLQPSASAGLFAEHPLVSGTGLLPPYNGCHSGSTLNEPDNTFNSWGQNFGQLSSAAGPSQAAMQELWPYSPASTNASYGTFEGHHSSYLGNAEQDLSVLPDSSVYPDWQEPMNELPITPTSFNSERSVPWSGLPNVSYNDSNTDTRPLPYAHENVPAAAGPSTLAGSIVEWSQHAPDHSTISYPWGTDGSSLASNSPRRIVLRTPSFYESPSPGTEGTSTSRQSSVAARHSTPLRQPRGRVCDQCRRGHIACPDRPRQPCEKCRARGIECTYND